jgi:hypothetical protein
MAKPMLARYAVLTADLVGSRHLPAGELEARVKEVAQAIEARLFRRKKTFEFYRGDSFQALLEKPEEALHIALLWRAAMKATSHEEQQWDIRVAIGIGELSHRGKTLAASGGVAFQRSGTLLDSMKHGHDARIAFDTEDESWTASLNTECILAEGIIGRWTATGAETIFQQLIYGETQEALASRLGVTQSAIHKRLQAVGWPAIRHWEEHYRRSTAQYLQPESDK